MGWRERYRLSGEEVLDLSLFLSDSCSINIVIGVYPVLLLLPFDIELHAFGGNAADRFVEVAVAPEGIAPKIWLQYIGTLQSNISRDVTLEVLCELGNAVVSATSYEQVHVIGPEVNRSDTYAQLPGFFHCESFTFHPNLDVLEYTPAVLRCEL